MTAELSVFLVGDTFSVRYKIMVNTALAEQDASELSQTPFSFKKGVIINRAAIGKTSVPKNDVSIERTGLSSAVKYEERHISTQPVI